MLFWVNRIICFQLTPPTHASSHLVSNTFTYSSVHPPIRPSTQLPPTSSNPSTRSPMHSLFHSITHPLNPCCWLKANGVTYCEQVLLYVESCNNNSRRTSNTVDVQVCGFKTQRRKSAKIAANNIYSNGGHVNSRVFQSTPGSLIQVRKVNNLWERFVITCSIYDYFLRLFNGY
jgi:hypothetical protein